jgi:threonine/homoserine/homoserine lactone efflux protein
MSVEFLLTSLVVVLIPGTGVIYREHESVRNAPSRTPLVAAGQAR